MIIRRFYLELVAWRRGGGGRTALGALSTTGMGEALSLLTRVAAEGNPPRALRIAAVVPLAAGGDGGSTAHILDEVGAAAGALAAAGVSGLDLWPQLDDDRTRFLNVLTAGAQRAALAPLLDGLAAARHRLPLDVGLALDVEPPQAFLHAAWRLGGSLTDPKRLTLDGGALLAGLSRHFAASLGEGPGVLSRLAEDVRRSGLSVHTAVLPFGAGPARTPSLRRRLLGIPDLDAHGAPLWDRPAAMCYPTMLDHFLGPIEQGRRRAIERRTLATWAKRHLAFARRNGLPPALVLGLLSHGVLGDEPVYRDASELAEDTRLACALGFEDLGFYALEGLLFGPTGVPNGNDFSPTRPDFVPFARAALG